jgi:hypothetical protein
MAEDLTPKLVSITDSAQFQAGGGARLTTVVRYMVGRFGPFEHTFERGPQRHEIDAMMTARKATLDGLV